MTPIAAVELQTVAMAPARSAATTVTAPLARRTAAMARARGVAMMATAHRNSAQAGSAMPATSVKTPAPHQTGRYAPFQAQGFVAVAPAMWAPTAATTLTAPATAIPATFLVALAPVSAVPVRRVPDPHQHAAEILQLAPARTRKPTTTTAGRAATSAVRVRAAATGPASTPPPIRTGVARVLTSVRLGRVKRRPARVAPVAPRPRPTTPTQGGCAQLGKPVAQAPAPQCNPTSLTAERAGTSARQTESVKPQRVPQGSAVCSSAQTAEPVQAVPALGSRVARACAARW